MKNTEILNYLRTVGDTAYDGMMQKRITECAYEYHRGQYDAAFKMRSDIGAQLAADAKALNWRLDDVTFWLAKTRKWTILPRNRKRIDAVLKHLEPLREPINDWRHDAGHELHRGALVPLRRGRPRRLQLGRPRHELCPLRGHEPLQPRL